MHHEPALTLTVPGNILLFGEYVILEEGGLGIAAAPGVYARLTADPIHESSPGLIILEGKMETHGPGRSWFLDTRSDDPLDNTKPVLLHSVWRTLGYPPLTRGWRLTLDTREFVYPDNRKRGFGSSAAAAVALTAALMIISNHPEGADPARVFPRALDAHRHFQGGRGSGYDVAASCFGGTGMFTGGAQPEWTSCHLPWLPYLGSYPGPEEIATPGSITAYTRWVSGHPSKHQALIQDHNHLLRALTEAATWNTAQPLAENLASLSLELGRTIGRSAEIPPPPWPHIYYKASGAGNELGVFFSQEEEPGNLKLSSRGLQVIRAEGFSPSDR